MRDLSWTLRIVNARPARSAHAPLIVVIPSGLDELERSRIELTIQVLQPGNGVLIVPEGAIDLERIDAPVISLEKPE